MRRTCPQLVGLLITFLSRWVSFLAEKVDLGVGQDGSALATRYLALIIVNSAIIELLIGSVK